MTGRLQGKVALVTGAASGIGRSTSLILGTNGATVACVDINLPLAEVTAKEIAAGGGTSRAHQLDVASEAGWQHLTAGILEEQERLDIVVNCAGVAHSCPVTEMDMEEWRRVMATNLDGVFLGTKHAVRAMRETGRGGCIVNVASVAGIKAQPEASAYSASKAGVIMFSKAVALECLQSDDNIRVNAVSPSGVKTPMWKTMPFFQELMCERGGEAAAFEAMVESAPHGRWASPDEVAYAILYLVSDESSFVTGTNLLFDNGDTA